MAKVLEDKLLTFIDAVKNAIADENWHAALAVALTIPDICGRLENENLSSNKRYVKWFNEYLRQTYIFRIGPEQKEHQFLTGEDMYALRCSYLHAGEGNIEKQWIRKVINDFKFVAPDKEREIIYHVNRINNSLQLQVDIFCLEICEAAQKWLEVNKKYLSIQSKAGLMIEIHSSSTLTFL